MQQGHVLFINPNGTGGSHISSTHLQKSKLDDFGNDVYSFMESILAVVNTIKGHILMHKKGDTTRFIMFAITSLNYVESSESWILQIQHVSSSAATPFIDDEDLLLSYTLVGTK